MKLEEKLKKHIMTTEEKELSLTYALFSDLKLYAELLSKLNENEYMIPKDKRGYIRTYLKELRTAGLDIGRKKEKFGYAFLTTQEDYEVRETTKFVIYRRAVK